MDKESLKRAVDVLCSAEDEEYKDLVRTLKTIHALPVPIELREHPELNVLLQLDDERFATFMSIVAVRRDKARATPTKIARRVYMREYMRKKRKAEIKPTPRRPQ